MAAAAAEGGEGAEMTWQEELAGLVDPWIRLAADGAERRDMGARMAGLGYEEEEAPDRESVRDQLKGFLRASVELAGELGRGCRDVVRQSLVGIEESCLVKKLRKPVAVVANRLEFLNEYLPEDKDPARAWPVVILVLILAFTVLSISSGVHTPVEPPMKFQIQPPSASRIQLPDGRYLAYHEQGVPTKRARISLIAPHSFLSSRLAGIPGIKASLLEEFGVRLLTYDLPGFGESDPHPGRDLNSSATDMLHIANMLGVKDKFWVVGYSGGAMHAWAALRYIPDRIAGAVMFAPFSNPYEATMTKEERQKTWEKWTTKKKLLYILARKFPSLLPYLYYRSFLSGKHGKPEKWLALSLGKKDKVLMENSAFVEFWEKDSRESARQVDSRPFVEEAVLQVSRWGFSLGDLQLQKNFEGKGFMSWLKSFLHPGQREWTGFLGPIHIWQGMDDRVVPPVMTEFVRRVIPGATVHMLHGEGHFSYFCFCNDCHRKVFSTLFGIPQGPLDDTLEGISEGVDPTSPEELGDEMSVNCMEQE